MLEFFADRLREERRLAGMRGAIRCWTRVLADLLTAATLERAAALGAWRRGRRPPSQTTTSTGDGMLQALLYDLRFAGRMLRKSPVFATVSILVIALATGPVSTIFSVANAIILRPIPGVTRPSELVTIQRTLADGSGSLSASHPYYRELAAGSRTLSGIAAWTLVPLNIGSGGDAISSLGNIVSGNYFDVLGVRPALGRFFSTVESRVPATYPVVVLSYGLWQRRFGGDSTVIGRSIRVNGSPYTVIGVAPSEFKGSSPVLRTDAWVPLMMQEHIRPGRSLLENPSAGWLELIGRLAPGASRQAARSEIATLTRRIATSSALGEPPHFAQFAGAQLSALSPMPGGDSAAMGAFFGVLLAVAGLVLMIAAGNVAGMLLARAVARRREMAVRVALGASRRRLIRQLLTETLVLFALGGAAGTLLAVWGARLLGQIDLPVDIPLALDVAPDARVLAFTLAVVLLTGITVGLAPALQASRLDLAVAFRGDTSGAGHRRSRTRNALIVSQMAMSLLLLAAAGLFLRSLERGRRVDPGFDADHVATASLNVGAAGYDDARGRIFYRALAARLTSVPGVTAVAFARTLPLSLSNTADEIRVDGYTPPRGRRPVEDVMLDDVDEGYFSVLRIPIREGRAFRADDDEHAPRVAVVNDAFAQHFWPGRSALGGTFHLDSTVVTVGGVVPNTKHAKLDEQPTPFMYLPIAQHWRSGVSLLVRTSGEASQAAAAIVREVRALDADMPAPAVTMLRQVIGIVLLPQRVAASVAGVLGLAGLLLAVVGLYGVISFSTAQRSREIAVRVALGAARGQVLRLVVGEGMRLVGVGMVIGVVLAVATTRALKPFLFGVSPIDPLTFLAIALTLGGAAFAASYLPARRAARSDPATILRQE
jgi:predicted permease